MAVVRQKRKSSTEEPQSLLQPSDSCASTLSDTYNPFSKKRRHEQEIITCSGSLHQQHPGGIFFGAQPQPQQILPQNQPAQSPVLDHALNSPLHPCTSLAGSTVSAFTNGHDPAASPQHTTATPPPGWAFSCEPRPAGSFISGDSHQLSSAGEQTEVAMQGETPHSQGPPPRFQFQPGPTLQRSNSAPDLRVLLAGPLNPIPQAALQNGMFAFGGSSSTAGALVPYKAPEEVIVDAHQYNQRRALEQSLAWIKQQRRLSRDHAQAVAGRQLDSGALSTVATIDVHVNDPVLPAREMSEHEGEPMEE